MADTKISALVDGSTDLAIADLLVFVDLSAGAAGTKKALVSALTQALGWQNVKTHGAVGDGVADDTAEIHAARDAAGAGGTVYFPPGTYLVSAGAAGGALQMSTANQRWIVAAGATIRLASSQPNQVRVVRVTAAGVRIEGPGTIDGNRAGQTQSTDMAGIEIASGGNDAVVQGVQITGARNSGVTVVDAARVHIRYNVISSCGSTGVALRGDARNAVVHGNTITAVDAGPIIAPSQTTGKAPHGSILSNNYLEVSVSNAFAIECGAFSGDRPEGLRIVDNRIVATAAHFGGISLAQCDEAVVAGNTYDDGGFAGSIGGIEIAGCTKCVAKGNTLITAASHPGISVDVSSRCIVTGNTINGWTAASNTAGIVVGSSSASESANENIVSGNVIIASSASAVDGIAVIANATSASASRNIVERNVIIGAGVASSRGISLVRFSGSDECSDNIVRDNQLINWPTGIALNGSSTLRNVVAGNKYTTVTTRVSIASTSGPFVLEDDAFTPAALAAGNTNDYAAQAFGTLRMSANASGSTLTGVAGGATPAHRLRIVNVSANTLTIAHEDTNSAAANRFTSPTGANVALGQNDCCDAEYDDVSQRWRIVNVLT